MRVLEIDRGGERQRVVTFLTAEEVARLGGVPPQAVVGVFTDGGLLRVNGVFREFLHETIAWAAPLDAEMRRVAEAHGDGRMVYVDARVPEALQPVPEEDVIGWFQIRGGKIMGYLPNARHVVDGQYGLTAVLAEMRQAMVDELARREGR